MGKKKKKATKKKVAKKEEVKEEVVKKKKRRKIYITKNPTAKTRMGKVRRVKQRVVSGRNLHSI